jgi:hypothetical protein
MTRTRGSSPISSLVAACVGRSRQWLAGLRTGSARLKLLRQLLLVLALVLGVKLFGDALPPPEKISGWLAWRYFMYWAIAGSWVLACSSAGFLVLRRVLRSPLPLMEHWTLSFAVGLLVFFWVMFVGGVLGLFGPAFFVAVLVTPIAVASAPLLTYLRRLTRHLRAARARGPMRARHAERLLWGLGVVALFLFYIPSLVPEQIGYDSAWYHVPLGEHYARLGRIERLPEGWFPGAVPHLSSLVYCFAFLLPTGKLFDYVELSSHLEFATTVMAMLGIPALVRRLVPGARAHVAWVAYFAFPPVYYYDSLIGGDQISSVWGIPIALALLRTWTALDWRHGVVLACTVAGLTLTKYSASGLLLGPGLAIGIRMVWILGRSIAQRAPRGVVWSRVAGGLSTGAFVLLFTAPLWAKNWLWYGDPFYPLLPKYFAGRPWVADALTYLEDYRLEMADFQPSHDWAGVKAGIGAVFDHALKPADYSPRPLRGSLFTLMCLCLPFVRARARLWGIAAVVSLAVFGWYMQMHQDRYLLAFLPLMAAVAVALMILAWRSAWLARPVLAALVVIHTVAGLAVFAVGNPNGQYRRLLDFINAVNSGAADPGMGDLGRWARVGDSLPPNAKVVVHAMHLHAGLGRPSISDWPRLQLGINYGRMASPAEMHRLLKSMGATHLVWHSSNRADDSYAGDLRFHEFVKKYTSPRAEGGVWVGTLPEVSPPDAPRDPLVAFLGCDGRYAPGLYRFSSMAIPNPRGRALPPYPAPLQGIDNANAEAALAQAHYVVYNRECGIAEPASLRRDFLDLATREGYRLFARRD